MGREFKISDKKRKAVIDNLVNMVEVVLKEQVDVDNYLITEQKIADKYKVDIEEIIFLEKKAIPFEMDIKNAKIRRAVILINLYDKGLDFYKENDGKLKSDFTDAVILNENGEILFLLRNKKDSI